MFFIKADRKVSKMNEEKTKLCIVGIVGIVAAVGIFILLMGAGIESATISGQATSAIKIKKPTTGMEAESEDELKPPTPRMEAESTDE